MSEKKRVRVYAPQVNTDHFAQYMFEVGGPVDAPGMMQPQDTSNDVVELLQTYAQVAGLDEQQLQQMYSAIMSMEPDKQAQAIAQIQQELNSSVEANPMMAKDGGGIKATKKLLAKKIGGVSINSNKEKETKVRSMTVANEAAKKFMENILEDTTKENLSRSMNPTMPAFDYGGYYNNPMFGMRGIRDVEDDPTYQQMLRIQNDAFSSIRDAGKALGNIGFRVDENEPIKVKRTGVARNFGNNPAQVSTDVPTQRDGGDIPSYQNAGKTSVWYLPSVNMPYIGQSDAMKVTPEGAFPVYGNKPFIIEKSSKSVLGSPYMDDYSRFKTYQANSEGTLESKTDESYLTRNIGGDRVYSYPNRYVRMDTLGYSQGRQEFPVVVTEKNIADGFGGSYDVNRFNATREQVPALIRSMKNQTSQTNAEKVKANTEAVHKNALKVEKNRRKVLKLSPLSQYEEEQILKGNYENGGAIPSYEPGGNTWMTGKVNLGAAGKVLIRDNQGMSTYVTPEEAQSWNDTLSKNPNATLKDISFQSDILDDQGNPIRLGDYPSGTQTVQFSSGSNNTSTNTGSNTGASGATGINGWYGGIYWQNGVPVTTVQDMMTGMQQGMGAGTDFSQIFQSGDRRSRIQGSLMDLVRNPYAMKQFGEALDQFGYPVKKIKAGINPLGARVKIIFNDKGNPVGQQVAGQNDGSSYGTPVQSNLANRIRSGFQSNVDEGESSGFMNKFNSAFEKMKTRRYNRKYGEPEMPSTGQSSTTSGPPVPMGRTSGSGMGSVYEPDITTPNPVYAPVQVSLRQTMESLDENQFEYGGIPKARAGKLVLKQGTDWDTASIGQALPTLMNSAANIAELSKIPSMQERIYNVGRYVPSLPSDQIGNRGTFMTGPGAGKIMPDMQNMPYAEAYYQNPVANMMGTSFELGGQYEEGGYYELDDDQLDDIFRNGGQVQYI